MTRKLHLFSIAALLATVASAEAQNPPVRNPPGGRGAPPQRGAQTANQPQTPPPPPATHNPKWVACYDVSIADESGVLRAYGTFDLDSAANARGITGHRHANVIGGTRMMRAGWQDAAGDSLRLTAAYIDAGFMLTLGTASADSMKGHLKGYGVGVKDSAATVPAVAKRRPRGCSQKVPLQAIRAATATLETDYMTVVMHPPLVEPAWLVADSMIIKNKGQRVVKNALLLRFRGGSDVQRHALVQSLGGIVVGSIMLPRDQRDNLTDFIFIVYVEDGATYDDLQRVARRATYNPIVRQIGLYLKAK